MSKVFPKVLIVGYPFDMKTGGGITMSNLFQDWPKDKLALVSNANLLSNPDISVCRILYQLGYSNKLHPFPLGLILPEIKTGIVEISAAEKDTYSTNKIVPGRYRTVYKILFTLLHFFGIYNLIYKLKITPEFREWLTIFNPDVIYSQLSTLELIRFVNEVHTLTGKPLVIHMMDDWPVTINKPGLFSFYWGRVIEKEFRQLLDKSSVLMSICDTMSEEYKIRYNKDFLSFHNPIDTNFWMPYSKTDYAVKNKFTVLYAGRISQGIKESIKDIASAVNKVFIDNPDIMLEIQTSDISELNKVIQFNDHITWVKPKDYRELPVKFSGADLLVLPYDFDNKSIDFLRFSFSTKISEFMISGTPILVYADKQTAMAKYALKDKWAYVVTENRPEKLVNAIRNLYSDIKLRKRLGERAKELAIKNEDSQTVRERFRKCFIIN